MSSLMSWLSLCASGQPLPHGRGSVRPADGQLPRGAGWQVEDLPHCGLGAVGRQRRGASPATLCNRSLWSRLGEKACGFGVEIILLVCSVAVGWAQTPAYKNPDLPAEQRAADIVSRMTLEEKVLQMQDGFQGRGEQGAPAIPRLEIPAYDFWNEALHGVARAGLATVFPQAIGLAATWDTDMMHRVADTIATEARAKYNQAQRDKDYSRYHGLTFWSPNINIFRDPRWGRGQETYGEDPYLTGRMAVTFITGMQGD